MRTPVCCVAAVGAWRLRHPHRWFRASRWQDPTLTLKERRRLLAKLKGTSYPHDPRYTARFRDPLGREGAAIRYWYAPNNQYGNDIIDVYNRHTDRLLAEGNILTHAPLTAANVQWSTILTTPWAPAPRLPRRQVAAIGARREPNPSRPRDSYLVPAGRLERPETPRSATRARFERVGTPIQNASTARASGPRHPPTPQLQSTRLIGPLRSRHAGVDR